MAEFKVGDEVTSPFLRGVGVITEIQNLIAHVKGSHIIYRDGNFVDGVRALSIGHLTKVPSLQENDTKQILEKFMSGTKFNIDGVPTNSLDVLVNAIVCGNKIEEQKYIVINGFNVPEPCYNLCDVTGIVYVIYGAEVVKCASHLVSSHFPNALVFGLVHLTEEAAQTHLDALLSFTKKNETIQTN